MSRRAITLLAVAPLGLFALTGTCLAQNTDRVSVLSTGGALPSGSATGKITPGGRFAVFTTAAQVIPTDTNGRFDVYVRDRFLANTSARISVPDPSMGGESNGTSSLMNGSGRVISDDGRFVIFSSDADNLVPNDINGVQDVFVRDRDLDGNGIFDEPGVGKTRTVRVSVTSNESQATGPCPNQICDHYSDSGVISANGRYVAWQSQYGFTSDPTAFMNVYWRDRDADNDGIYDEVGGTPDAAVTRLVSKRIGSQFVGQTGDGFSQNPTISANGRWVAFESVSRFMVFSDSVSNQEIFARDMFTDTQNIRITEPVAGGQPDSNSSNASISSNGRYIAFSSGADNLAAGVNTAVSNIVIKDRDADNNGVLDDAGGVAFINASIGRNPFVLPNGIVNLNDHSMRPTISDDGRYVAFDSTATNFLCGLGCTDTNGLADVLVYDRVLNSTSRPSVAFDGAQAQGTSRFATISPDGRFVAFASNANFLDGTVSTAFDNVYVRAIRSAGADSCGTALPLSTGATSGDTWGSAASGETTCGNSTNSSAVWFTYTAECTGQVTMDTSGSAFDTVLAAFSTPCPATANKQIVCNDDVGQGILHSQITFPITQGQVYVIRVGGFEQAAGFFRLTVAPAVCQPPCPADFNGDGNLDPDDLSDYITCFFTNGSAPGSCLAADFNSDGNADPDDLSDYITAFFSGCP